MRTVSAEGYYRSMRCWPRLRLFFVTRTRVETPDSSSLVIGSPRRLGGRIQEQQQCQHLLTSCILQLTQKVNNDWFVSKAYCLIIVLISAILITGGYPNPGTANTAELYYPSNRTSCPLPRLPDNRTSHTADENILCGGSETKFNCVLFSPYAGMSMDLDIPRLAHVSWTPGSGIGTYLMGGQSKVSPGQPRPSETSTLIKPEGTQQPGFALKHRIQ